jgi:hypothetical protein
MLVAHAILNFFGFQLDDMADKAGIRHLLPWQVLSAHTPICLAFHLPQQNDLVVPTSQPIAVRVLGLIFVKNAHALQVYGHLVTAKVG